MRYARYDITANSHPLFGVDKVPKLLFYHKLSNDARDYNEVDIEGKNEFEIKNNIQPLREKSAPWKRIDDMDY